MKSVVGYGKSAILTLLNHWHTVLAFYAIVIFGGGTAYMVAETGTEKAPGWVDSIYWAFVTSASIGYGDYFPVTDAGRVVCVFVGICGIWIVIPTIVVLMLQSVIQDIHKLTDLEQQLLIASANATQEAQKVVIADNEVLFRQNRLMVAMNVKRDRGEDYSAELEEFDSLQLPSRDHVVKLFTVVDDLEVKEEAETATNGH
jgi:hypothetical protein